jgi:hypothetical protein
MKAISTRVAVLLVGATLGFLLSGCASTTIKRLSGPEFVRQANQIGQLNSAHWTSYIGSSPGRAYLEFGYPAPFGKGSRTKVCWTLLSDLPPDLASKLKAGDPPRKP